MGGFFLRPKADNLDRTNNHINAEAIGVVAEYDNQYTGTSGFVPSQDGIAVHRRRHPSQATEPAPSFPPAVRAGGKGKRR